MSLREEIWQELLPRMRQLRLQASTDGEDHHDICRETSGAVIAEMEAHAIHFSGRWLSDEDNAWLEQQIEGFLGAGPIERFRAREDVENIYLFGPHRLVLSLVGGRQEHLTEPIFDDDQAMIDYIAHLASTHGQTARRFDSASPLLDLRLRTGERIFAAMEISGAPYLAVRLHRMRAVNLRDLAERGSVTVEAADFLRAAVRPPWPCNVLVCGALGAGKTTMLRALLAETDPSEVVCTLEQTFELFLSETHPLTFAVETREPNSDGSGEIAIEELARRSLRSGADRVIVGELRGSEAAVFLSACGTGSDGSMATIHAASARQALARLVRYSLQSLDARMQSSLVQEVADVIHLVVFMRMRAQTGEREVHTITEVIGADEGRFETHDIFGRISPGAPLQMLAPPRNPDLVMRLSEGGFDTSRCPAKTVDAALVRGRV
ncbi:MAG: ATPase, T2SS/T4P/T4SS family [Spirochaetaceae bacterium]|nr:ATPase, T2SS/T4P/T4SS family [Spirochaetaceae bacterium]